MLFNKVGRRHADGSNRAAVQTNPGPDFSLGANTYFRRARQWAASGSPAMRGDWRPLTDNQPRCRSIAQPLDPPSPSGKTIIAGIGNHHNGEYSQFNLNGGRGGPATVLLFNSHQCGCHWSAPANSSFARERGERDGARAPFLPRLLKRQRPFSATACTGLFRSTDCAQRSARFPGRRQRASTGPSPLAGRRTRTTPRLYPAVRTGQQERHCV